MRNLNELHCLLLSNGDCFIEAERCFCFPSADHLGTCEVKNRSTCMTYIGTWETESLLGQPRGIRYYILWDGAMEMVSNNLLILPNVASIESTLYTAALHNLCSSTQCLFLKVYYGESCMGCNPGPIEIKDNAPIDFQARISPRVTAGLVPVHQQILCFKMCISANVMVQAQQAGWCTTLCLWCVSFSVLVSITTSKNASKHDQAN